MWDDIAVLGLWIWFATAISVMYDIWSYDDRRKAWERTHSL